MWRSNLPRNSPYIKLGSLGSLEATSTKIGSITIGIKIGYGGPSHGKIGSYCYGFRSQLSQI